LGVKQYKVACLGPFGLDTLGGVEIDKGDKDIWDTDRDGSSGFNGGGGKGGSGGFRIDGGGEHGSGGFHNDADDEDDSEHWDKNRNSFCLRIR